MTRKEEMYRDWQCLSCECGDEDPNTKKARAAYFKYCSGYQDMRDLAIKWITENVGADIAADFITALKEDRV